MEELKMLSVKIKREILGVFMESPLYFTMPLRERLEMLNFFSQQSVYHRIWAYNENLIIGWTCISLRNGDPTDN
jgi:hypothetical protein